MTVFMYYDKKVRDLKGFRSKNNHDGSTSSYLDGDTVFSLEGSLHTVHGDPFTMIIGESIRDLITGVTYHDHISYQPPRESGLYRYESAEAELTVYFADRELKRSLRVRSKTLDNLRELITKIKSGTIRPEVSYENPQSGKSRAELESELAKSERRAQEAEALMTKLHTRNAELDIDLGSCRQALEETHTQVAKLISENVLAKLDKTQSERKLEAMKTSLLGLITQLGKNLIGISRTSDVIKSLSKILYPPPQ